MTLEAILVSPALQRWRRRAIFGAALLAGTAMLASGGTSVDRSLRVLRDTVRAETASGEIHLVEIDARSLAAIDRWPWPRGIHAQVIDRLRAAGARSIAFDVDLSAASTAVEDAKLAAALRRAGGTVILPTFRQAASGTRSDHVEAVPAKPFVDHAFLAAVNVVPDSDGAVRRMPLGLRTQDVPRPSLAAMVAERSAEAGRDFPIDYAIRPETIPRHSVIDLIEGRVPTADLRGRRVIVGATAIEMGDRYAAPGHGVIPGVVIQALAAETLLAGPVPRSIGGEWPLACALLLVAGALRGGSRRRRAGTLALAAAILFLVPIASEALWALSFAVAPALAALCAAAATGAAGLIAERFRQRALTDEATGLPNLAAIEQDAAGGGAIIVARIDRFAAIAAGLGPEAITRLVERTGERLSFALDGRAIYRTDDANLAWIEIDEDRDFLNGRFDSLAALMRAPIDCGRPVDVSLNFGLASTGAERRDPKQLVAQAALAALHAAQQGARWEQHSEADSDETGWHLSLLSELDTAMAGGQLWNAYQPKLDIASDRVVAVEALVRWLHPERGPVAPDRFIPVVEANGRARDLTLHVLAQAIEDAACWEAHGHQLGVAVNVSATLLADHGFIETVGQVLRGGRLPTGRVTIEVTESAAMADPERAIAALESWRALGVAISIDDYGTGQSSLGYLQKLPATELKIDKSFVQTVDSDQRNAIMVRSTVALAHELGMKVVAEGIEDASCLAALRAMGCDTAQGYLIGKPMASAMLLDYLAERGPVAAQAA